MKRILLVMALVLTLAPALFAQNHGELGAFFNFTRLADTSTNFYGVGGRVGFNLSKHVQLEGEGAYDFEQDFTLTASSAGNPAFVGQRAGLRMIHGLFGPKFQIGTHALRVYGTAKGGLINFSTASGFQTQISQISDGDTDAVFYPAGGVELYAGPLGIRAEIGDEIWFANTTKNNLRITIGPQIRF
jgi:hypothetical protein